MKVGYTGTTPITSEQSSEKLESSRPMLENILATPSITPALVEHSNTLQFPNQSTIEKGLEDDEFEEFEEFEGEDQPKGSTQTKVHENIDQN